MSAPAGTRLLTADEFFQLARTGPRSELVEGELVMMNMPGFRHGELGSEIIFALRAYLAKHDIARVVSEAGIKTRRDPDSVRGPDVALFTYQRLPKGARPTGYPDQSPELVFEVLSPTDRLKDVLAKVDEYLAAGVEFVVVVDPDRETVVVHRADRSQSLLLKGQSLTLPELLPGFELPLDRLFPGP